MEFTTASDCLLLAMVIQGNIPICPKSSEDKHFDFCISLLYK